MVESPEIAGYGGGMSPDAVPPEAPAQAGVVHAKPVIIKDRYLIDLNVPLPGLDTPSAGAFSVSDRKNIGKKIFALACTPGLPVRTKTISSLMEISPRGALPIIDSAVVPWPPLRQSTMVVLYEQPMGGRLTDTFANDNTKIGEHEISHLIINPLVNALGSFTLHNISHRSIRPRNMFFMDEDKTEVVMGDCVTVPPGFDQPVVFETIERGMASPGGRGEGSVSDDIYALGVAIVFFLLRGNPVEGMSEEAMFKSKIEQGSYATLCGKMRIPVNLIEALRGMLSDDVKERWDIDLLSRWLDGQRRTPIQKKPAAKVDKPFIFDGNPHHSPRTLAYAFTKKVDEAAKAIRDPELATWLRRSAHSPELSVIVSETAGTAQVLQDKPQGSNDYIVTKVSFAFDPDGPVRYKGFSFMPDAYGTAMAVELLLRGDAQTPAEVVAHDIIGAWFAEQNKYDAQAIAVESRFRQTKKLIQDNIIGFGIERVLYELNPGLPCQSPLIKEDYVVYIDDLLPALNAAANRVDAKSKPMDRHIAAFIATRFDQDISPHLAALSSPEEEKSLIGMLSLLAFLQWHLKLESLFGLASWLGGLLGPAINTYSSRSTRREIEREIPKLVRKGSLPEIFDAIDNVEKRSNDLKEFTEAKKAFKKAENEIQEIEGKGGERAAKSELTGQKIAAMCSIMISMIVVTILLLFANW